MSIRTSRLLPRLFARHVTCRAICSTCKQPTCPQQRLGSGNHWIQKGFLKEDKAGSWHVQVLILPLSHQQHRCSTAKSCFFVPSHPPFHFFSFIKYVSRNNFLLFNIKFLLTSPSFPRLNQHNFVNCEFSPFCALYTALISEFTQFCFTWFRGSFCFYTEKKKKKQPHFPPQTDNISNGDFRDNRSSPQDAPE